MHNDSCYCRKQREAASLLHQAQDTKNTPGIHIQGRWLCSAARPPILLSPLFTLPLVNPVDHFSPGTVSRR
jgi:hypothetical protein